MQTGWRSADRFLEQRRKKSRRRRHRWFWLRRIVRGGGRTNGGNAQLVSAAGCGCGRQDVELLVRRRRRQQIDGSGYPLFSEMAVPNDRNADFTGSTLQRLTQ
jgi:hypothetical protein